MSRLDRPYVPRHDLPCKARLPKLNGYDLEELTVAELQHHYHEGHFSIEAYTAFCLDRIRVLNPYLEAVIETNPDALNIARDLDKERLVKTHTGSLYGVPVLVKDNIATKDQMQTTAGSWALLGSVAPEDAFVVQRLRQEGAVIVGHANMSEWASVRSKAYSTGYSPRGGQVRNPFDLRRTPFGSSSGSAVAVSANLVPLALGTETDTSIIGPASINGVVGIKPTVGLTSRSGVIPISESMDSVGTFGRTVADAAAGLDAIVGIDERDRFTAVPERQQNAPYSRYISSRGDLQDCKAVASKVFEAVREAGATIIEVDLPSVEERLDPDGGWNWEHGGPDKSEWTVAKVEAYNSINAYLGRLTQTAIKSLEDVVEYNKQNSGTEGAAPREVPAFPNGQDNLLEIMEWGGRKDATYHSALKHIQKQTRTNGIDAALRYTDTENNAVVELDALLFCDRRGAGQQYAAQAGYPIICIPIGLDEDGLPISLSIQHSVWKEDQLIKWASAIEDAWNAKNGWRAIPTFKHLTAKNIPILGLGARVASRSSMLDDDEDEHKHHTP
ncbi:hypothetical protein LTR70_007177 [Exophiala xenobiotica]|uniref:Amidase domain-containing protein n=1 Tax=Lithohypha guttulata TaxID=1690604 RepID=A0ABR0KFF6_9EURO|nr:hypothetical protein LTR24_003264 [Lithohypha guttulata]KAK5314462.1 hypothetical protein LTR70_007177 [Exophiala xenobiotica]